MTDTPVTWTPEELAEFNRLTLETSSRDQLTRISARMNLSAFIAKHGTDKCDAMFAVLTGATNGQ